MKWHEFESKPVNKKSLYPGAGLPVNALFVARTSMICLLIVRYSTGQGSIEHYKRYLLGEFLPHTNTSGLSRRELSYGWNFCLIDKLQTLLKKKVWGGGFQ